MCVCVGGGGGGGGGAYWFPLYPDLSYQGRRAKIFRKNVRVVDLCPPAFGIGISDLLGEHHKDEEDEESLEGHHDGVDVGQRDQLFHFHYQHSQYPRQPHDDHKKHC